MKRETVKTARRILEAAAQSFREKGLPAVSMREVAKKAGVTPMAIYRHYADKATLVEAVVAHGFEEYERYVGAPPPDAEPLAALRHRAGRIFDFAVDHPVFFELMFLSPQASREIVSAQRMRSIHAPTYKIAYEAVRSWRIGQRQVNPSNSVLTLSLLSYCIGFCAFHLNATMNLSDSAAREQYMIGLEALLAP
ncbi:TetR/AcrR family transcriptional regulator [Novosphingobium olei]|uniref:TetR/AcrR family transcriptional regulator n=1 Tax=Novosphingobium olei TaxID=2728851 RepID=UPI00308654A8|nr:TetR/AcrR family transcriptional regulator [Novosphingobium olei]